jgi:ABC-type polysaccharide/polyol phosphate transport system ATPase subunit
LDLLTLTIKQGERVGILGRNGAGKTTLLRLLAGIFTPSLGSASVNVDTATILDSGYGVEPWLTGRENAVSRLIVTGVPRKQHAEILIELEAFLDLGPYFNEPTRTYSAGMLARLVFGMATVRRPAVLIVDEGFGTVDDQFQHAAWQRLNSVIGSTTTLIMASHNLEQLRKHCIRGIVLNKGRIIVDSDIETAIETYVV